MATNGSKENQKLGSEILNPNFEKSYDVSVNDDLAIKRQRNELLAAANRFIAFEYNGNENNKYSELDLEKIHSSFWGRDKNELIEEVKKAVCGGVYNEKKFNQAKEKSIYSGVDKFKATIDNKGFLVIHSVGDTINDAHFEGGVVTKFKFPIPGGGVNGLPKEITKDNLHELFTNGSDAKDSGLSLLGAIELTFSALFLPEILGSISLIKCNDPIAVHGIVASSILPRVNLPTLII